MKDEAGWYSYIYDYGRVRIAQIWQRSTKTHCHARKLLPGKKWTVIILSNNFNISSGKASSRLGRAKFMPNRRKRTAAWPQVSTRIVFELINFTRAVVQNKTVENRNRSVVWNCLKNAWVFIGILRNSYYVTWNILLNQ